MLISLKNNKFLSGSAIYLLSNVLNAIIPFLLLPVLTRFLTPEEYGEVAMFQTWVGMLAAFVGLSLNGAAIRKYYDGGLGEDELKEYVGACLQILITVTLISFIGIVIFKQYLSQWLGLSQEWVISGVLVAACTMLVQIRLGQWQVKKQAIRYGIFQVGQGALNITLSLLLVVWLLEGADGRVFALILTGFIFSIYSLLLLRRDNLLHFLKWRPDYIGEALKFGLPLVPHVGGAYLLLSVDRIIINSKLGLDQVGIYMVAVQFGSGISLILDAVNKSYVPWLFERLKRDDDSEKKQIVILTYAWYFLIVIGVFVAFIVGPWLVVFVAGEEYAMAGEIFGWIALGQGFRGMYLMQTNYIFFSKRTGLLSLITLSVGLFNVGLMFFLIDKYGLLGAAYSFSIAMGTLFIFTWLASNKRHPMPWFKFKGAQ